MPRAKYRRPHPPRPRQPSLAGLLAALCLLAATPLSAQEKAPTRSLPKNADYQRGLRAMADHLPEVAAGCFEETLADEALPPAERATVEAKLLEALVRAQQHAKALALTESHFHATAPPPAPAMTFWRALALAGSGRLTDADALLAPLTSATSPLTDLFPEAVFTRSSILRALDAPGDALKLLEAFVAKDREPAPTPESAYEAFLRMAELHVSLNRFTEASDALSRVPPPSPAWKTEAAFLQARIALGEKRWKDAIAGLSLLIGDSAESKGVPEPMRELAVVALADALDGAGQRPQAITLASEFISANPQSPVLFPLFERLEAMGYFATPDIAESLVTWPHSEHPSLAALGSYFLGVAVHTAVSPEAAIDTFTNFTATFPDHFLVDRALLWLSQLQAAAGDKAAALASLKSLRERSPNPTVIARVAFLEARADFATEDFRAAATKFQAIGESADDEAAPVATFNAALAALGAGDTGRFDLALEHLGSFNRPNLRGELFLERGLFLASGDPAAAAPLFDAFLLEYPGHSRAGEAHLALASLYLVEFPPKIKSARAELAKLAKLAKLAPTPDQSEAADYIAVWIEVSGENPEEVITLGQRFLTHWPQSRRAPEILMKIAEVYLQRQDFANAQARFEALAETYPNTPQAEPALYFAGKAAMRINTEASREKALDIWQRVVKMDRELALAARMQQAMVKRVQKKDSEAIAIIDKVLESQPEGDVFYEALHEKGQVLYIAGDPTPEGMRPAIETFRTALARPSIPPKWRYEALYRLGKCQEKAGQTDAALSSYYKAIHRPDGADPTMDPGEYEWFFRCGESALRLLEAADNWKASIAIYRQLGAIPGPRAQYALDRARTLELKYFVWSEEDSGGL